MKLVGNNKGTCIVRQALLGMICITGALLSACDSSTNTAYTEGGFFPLEEGRTWHYRVVTSLIGKTAISSTLSIENIGKKDFHDKTYWLRRTSYGTDYYFREASTGVYRYGKRTLVELKPRLDAIPRMVLPFPIPTKRGKSWSVLTQSYTLHRVLPNYEPPSENIANFHMTYSVVGLDEEVSVPAGTFKHCLLIEGQAQVDQYGGSNTKEGAGEIEITTREWYAPNVGMVKMERTEPLDGSVFKGGKIVMELLSRR